jgi:hypothetical protein
VRGRPGDGAPPPAQAAAPTPPAALGQPAQPGQPAAPAQPAAPSEKPEGAGGDDASARFSLLELD